MVLEITYEKLFEVLRREKEREELQELDKTFYQGVVEYIQKMVKELEEQSNENKKKKEQELENVKKILKELYERREKKIVNLALDKSRTGVDLIDIAILLEEERNLLNSLVEVLTKFRNVILLNILSCKTITKKQNKKIHKETKLVRFLHPVPRFVGKKLEQYGPFEEDEIANLPQEIADILITKGRAEEIKEK